MKVFESLFVLFCSASENAVSDSKAADNKGSFKVLILYLWWSVEFVCRAQSKNIVCLGIILNKV